VKRRAAIAIALLGLFVGGFAAVAPGRILALITSTVSDNATVSDSPATGDFTYDGQTIKYSDWASNMGDASGGKLLYVTTPFSFDCSPGSLTASLKKAFDGSPDQGDVVYTFTVGAGSDPAVPAGSVIVGVGIHSGTAFSVKSSEWVNDGSQVKITLDKGFSNAKVFYCTPSSGTTTTGGTTSTSTSISTTTVTTTVTQPATTLTTTVPGTTVTAPPVTLTQPVTITITVPAVTVTTPGTTTIVTVPAGSTTTVTLPEQTVTLPASTQTLAGQTIEHDPVTVTQPGTTQTITAGATTTVVTVTAPHRTVEGGVRGEKTVVVTLTGPTQTISVPPHIVKQAVKARVVKEVVKVETLVRTIAKEVLRACKNIGFGKG